MDEYMRKIETYTHYLGIAIMSASIAIILLFPPINQFLMRSSGSYVIYMIVFAFLIGLSVYISERLLSDVFGSNEPYTP